ncbi:MAG: hypothetical protein N2Z74_09910, partial [Syntrophales bacterium]|nr:hypothetical protein [Syntrophales bacterium]
MSYDFTIQSLGEPKIPSPVSVSSFTSDERRVLFNNDLRYFDNYIDKDGKPLSLEVAGPRAVSYTHL